MGHLPFCATGRRQLGRCFAVVFVLMFGVADVAQAAASNGWSAPVPVAPDYTGSANSFGSVSCASSSFCAVTDGTSDLFTFNGSDWSTITLDGFSGDVDSLSCPTDSLCAGLTDERQEPCDCSGVMTYNATSGSWTQQTFESDYEGSSSQDDIDAVSCASASFCMAIGEGLTNATATCSTEYTGVYSIYNGTQWSAAVPFCESASAAGNGLYGLSCPSSAFCMAIDGGDDVYTYNGSGWAPAPGPSGATFGDGTSGDRAVLSCVFSMFCVASQEENGFTGTGGALFYNGSGWSSVPIPNPADYPDLGTFSGLSCTTTSFCVGVNGYAATYQNGAWADPQAPDSGHPGDALSSVTCTSSSFCMAVDDAGYALTYSGASSSPPGSGTPPSSPKPKPKPTSTVPHNPSGPLRAKRITSTSITLSWGAAKGGPPAPTGYGVAEVVQGNERTIATVSARKHQFTIRHLRPHHRYRFVVWSFTADNSSDGISGTWKTT